ncbi:RNA 3'-terminal phosphate cyclase [Cordyceps militaris CM01]|uniref:RNA 3'-terminal phosphate cyclase n=1 Tax=Cordyceps militaris (strain CM01) TaxID=983644 RepID=G3JIH4_CORMM|nr:RNA 3'-terminal phosphate cyclase [Cordyceps militaris CM01]EGX91075.1 RNA 3'-terminal phosphate cyclase [Cordyceps militaris CM01]
MMVKPIELDGRTGEGGGQLVRVAVGLAALTSQPVRIAHVRGNRGGPRGGGLKVQHVTSIRWLADVTGADVEGLSVGSGTLTFIPKKGPADLAGRSFEIKTDTEAASALLILQAIFPFVLFAGHDNAEPLTITIHGGTNVTWSLSYEYFDQVLMPALEERFAIRIDRKLNGRSWSNGKTARGSITLTVYPVPKGKKLHYSLPKRYTYPASYEVKMVNISILAPAHAHEHLQNQLFQKLGELYPDADLRVKLVEDSGSNQKWNVLLVAESRDGIRWARDILRGMPKKMRSSDSFVKQVANSVCRDLHKETSLGGQVDEHLQDQLVVVQALCDGYSSFPRGDGAGDSGPEARLAGTMGNLSLSGDRVRKDKTYDPFGHGSMHTQTARWVASRLLPAAEFYNKGDFVKGVGFSV